jgi:hypothetical protein
MTTRRRAMILAGLLVTAAGFLAWSLLPLPEAEPLFEGRPLGLWLKEFDGWSGYTNAPVVRALRGMGTNAVPALVKLSLTRPTPVRSWLWWTIESRPALKKRWGKREITPAQMLWGRADTALGILGPSARPAVPLLQEALADKDSFVRARAVSALGAIGSLAEDTLPVLLSLTNDPSSGVRGNLMLSLAKIGRSPDACNSALTNGLNDRDPQVRQNAAVALAHFGGFGPGGRLLQ